MWAAAGKSFQPWSIPPSTINLLNQKCLLKSFSEFWSSITWLEEEPSCIASFSIIITICFACMHSFASVLCGTRTFEFIMRSMSICRSCETCFTTNVLIDVMLRGRVGYCSFPAGKDLKYYTDCLSFFAFFLLFSCHILIFRFPQCWFVVFRFNFQRLWCICMLVCFFYRGICRLLQD